MPVGESAPAASEEAVPKGAPASIRPRRRWSRRKRVGLGIAAGSVLALAVVVSGIAMYSGVIAPQLAAITARKCHAAYESSAGRQACEQGHRADAVAADKVAAEQQKLQATREACAAQFSDSTAQQACSAGDASRAASLQKAADDAAAAARKLATQGQSADNPYPVGMQIPMVSTNRLDGSKTTYTEWVSDFNPNWTGYNQFEAPGDGFKYVSYIVHVQATDAGVEAGTVAYDASFTDQNGSAYSRDAVSYSADPAMPSVALGAGQQASGIVVFKVPVSVTGGVATFGHGTVFAALG